MGKAVAEFLQPFGVDVDISVTDKNAHKTTDASKPASEPTSNGSTEKPAGNPDESSPSGVVAAAYKVKKLIFYMVLFLLRSIL